MQNLPGRETMDFCGTVLPLAILLIENDEDRQFLTEMYLQYRKLMYKTASHYFQANSTEIEDAVSASVERMCKYCKNIQAVTCNKRTAYIVRLVENVCRTRIRAIARQRDREQFPAEENWENDIPDTEDTEAIVFSHLRANDLLMSFDRLSVRDQELIRMRHIDYMEFEEMAREMGMTVSAVRTALFRAKQRWKKLASEIEDISYEG
ncbi:MAG: sigma-70 family RNA polymerase sigma factor [Clostridia bacterium]|nr:sigma-70 family RNA polymerase sigma factor [Clostridia bacterium]